MNQRFLHGLPVTIYRHYGSIHLVGAMAGKARLLPLSSGHDAGEPAGNMSVPRYWRKVLSGAWDKTYKPLDWTGKKAAVVLVAVGTIILAGVHLGPGATFASVSGYLWISANSVRGACAFRLGSLANDSRVVRGTLHDKPNKDHGT